MSGRGIFNQSRMKDPSSCHEPPRLSLDQQGISTRWSTPIGTNWVDGTNGQGMDTPKLNNRKMGTTITIPPNETVHQPLPSTLFRGFKDEIGSIRECAWLPSSNPQLPPTVSLLIPISHIQTRSQTKKDKQYQTRKQQEGKSQTVTNRTLTHSPTKIKNKKKRNFVSNKTIYHISHITTKSSQ